MTNFPIVTAAIADLEKHSAYIGAKKPIVQRGTELGMFDLKEEVWPWINPRFLAHSQVSTEPLPVYLSATNLMARTDSLAQWINSKQNYSESETKGSQFWIRWQELAQSIVEKEVVPEFVKNQATALLEDLSMWESGEGELLEKVESFFSRNGRMALNAIEPAVAKQSIPANSFALVLQAAINVYKSYEDAKFLSFVVLALKSTRAGYRYAAIDALSGISDVRNELQAIQETETNLSVRAALDAALR